MLNIDNLKQENRLLQEKIQKYQLQRESSSYIKSSITNFIIQSKANLQQMHNQMGIQLQNQNLSLHSKTIQYENVLKKQIQLLAKNKQLSDKKQSNHKQFNLRVSIMRQNYEKQIDKFEKKVDESVKKIKKLDNESILKRLIKNNKFRQNMLQKGLKIQKLQKQSELEDISNDIQQKEKEIVEQENRSKKLDIQLDKMHNIIHTLKEMLENIIKQKEKIVNQHLILKESIKKSDQLFGNENQNKQSNSIYIQER